MRSCRDVRALPPSFRPGARPSPGCGDGSLNRQDDTSHPKGARRLTKPLWPRDVAKEF